MLPQSCCRKRVYPGGKSYMYLVPWFLPLMPTFCSYHPGDVPWSPGSDGIGGFYSGSHRTVTNEESSWLAATPGTVQMADWYTPQVFLWRRPICFSWSFGLRVSLLAWHTPRGLLRCTLLTEPSGHHLCTLPLPWCRSLVSPGRMLLYSFIWCPMGLMLAVPQDCM